MLDFYVKTGIRFSLRDKRLFEITEVEITRVDCIKKKSLMKLCFEIDFPSLNSPQNLGPSYKTDHGFWDCLRCILIWGIFSERAKSPPYNRRNTVQLLSSDIYKTVIRK